MNKKNQLMKKEEASDVAKFVGQANQLKDFIVKAGLYSNIKGRNYVNVEGWEFAGVITNLVPMITKVKNISTDKEIKYRAEAELINTKTKSVDGFGVAICSNKERSKVSFDEYAIASMAQTRAIGKAFRNKLAFLMKMAGYEPTPAEEMNGVKDDPTSGLPTPASIKKRKEENGNK